MLFCGGVIWAALSGDDGRMSELVGIGGFVIRWMYLNLLSMRKFFCFFIDMDGLGRNFDGGDDAASGILFYRAQRAFERTIAESSLECVLMCRESKHVY